jgi:hypothetical protein
MAFFCSASLAANDVKLELDFVISSKIGGTQYLLYEQLKPLMEEKGYKINVVVPGNCVKSGVEFLRSEKPTLLVVFNSYLALEECSDIQPNRFNWVVNLTKSQLMICEQPGYEFLKKLKSNERIPVGSVNVYPPAILESLDSDISYVPYKTSGALVRGFLANDVNVIITNSLRASQLVKKRQADCVLATGDRSHLGAPAATSLLPDWDHAEIYQLFAVLQKNVPQKMLGKLRQDMKALLLDPRWQQFASASGYDVDPTLTPMVFTESSRLWARNGILHK